MQVNNQNIEDIPREEDVPKQNNYFPVDNENSVKPNEVSKDVFNTIKGHNLLNICVFFIVLIYMVETFKNGGKTSNVGELVIEILKLLIFSVAGYLFGAHNSGGKD